MAERRRSRQSTAETIETECLAEQIAAEQEDNLMESVSPQNVSSRTLRRRPPLLERLRGKRRHMRRPKRSLVEDYYRVDTIASPSRKTEAKTEHYDPVKENEVRPEKRFKVVLPGLPSYEDDWARDSHDFFNLVAIVPVVVLNCINWNWEILLTQGFNSAKSINATLSKAWTGDWFDYFFFATATYFIIDLLWISVIPNSVRSPSVIAQHHVAAFLFILIPYFHEPVRWCMGACMAVEINTWFLIARRVFNKQGFPPWTIGFSWLSIRVKVISILFYLTWISIRCVLYPMLMIPFYLHWRDLSNRVGWFNILFPAVPLHFVFCLLNLKWSYELLMSKLRYIRRRRRGTVPVVDTSSSQGL